MPGGLTRVAASARARMVVSMQRGGGSKDTWVLADGPVSAVHAAARRPARPVELTRAAAATCPSRVADNLFWLGRYAERGESLVRLFRAATSRLRRGHEPSPTPPELAVLVRAMVTLQLVPAGAAASSASSRLEAQVLDAMLADGRQPGRRARCGRCAGSRGWSATACRPTPGASLDQLEPGLPRRRRASRRAGDAPRAAEPDRADAGGVQRRRDGEHDARARLAVPRHRPAARARRSAGHAPPRHAPAGRRRRGAAAGRCSRWPTAR